MNSTGNSLLNLPEIKIISNCRDSNTSRQSAIALGEKYGFELVDEHFLLDDKQAVLQYHENKLILHLLLEGKVSQLFFDFAQGEVGFRASRVSKANEVVAKALGVRPHYRPKVLDATAGMGRDAMIMAQLGCHVVMQERNLIVYLLLNDALSRFKANPKFHEVSQRMSLLQKNSIDFGEDNDVDVIYLDPMFPERKKSALVKKEMRMLKRVTGEDADAESLLENALRSKIKRVVVKRPKGAPALTSTAPSHEIAAKKFRYDVYLTTRCPRYVNRKQHQTF